MTVPPQDPQPTPEELVTNLPTVGSDADVVLRQQTADATSHGLFPTVPETSFLDLSPESRDRLDHSPPLSGGVDYPSDLPNQIGEYKIVRLLGYGGMGRVYLAEHVRMQRSVALKVLPLERINDALWVKRFFDEIRVASRLLHPNIVTAFDAGELDGLHYLAMEYVDGVTLTTAIEHAGPMSLGEAASVIRQAAMGLHHAHRAGVVHRDVKPGNLMRAVDGTVKVLDLGLAQVNQHHWSPANRDRDVDLNRRPNRFVGTLSFMAPEQIDNPESVDARCDIYALGATLYYLLIGRPPYTGKFLDIVDGHRAAELPELMRLRDDIDLQFDHIFRHMMAKSPAKRFGSLDEVIDELAPYCRISTTPAWISDLSIRTSRGELSAISSGDLAQAATHVIAIDLGMFYITAAESDLNGKIEMLTSETSSTPYTRLAISADRRRLVFGDDAISRRETHPQSVLHCLPMYIGRRTVDRPLGGVLYPPEALLAIAMRNLIKTTWKHRSVPDAAAVVVPSVYDQLHRRSLLQASELAGLQRIRLIDRSLAATQSMLQHRSLHPVSATGSSSATPDSTGDSRFRDEHLILFLGLTGQASEISVIRHRDKRMHQLSTAGHWNTGTLSWLQMLVGHVAERVRDVCGVDPREDASRAAILQVRCERLMNSLLLSSKARISIPIGRKRIDVMVQRETWLGLCAPLLSQFIETMHLACKRASVQLNELGSCVVLGPLLRLPEIRTQLLQEIGTETEYHCVERADMARGAAACIVAELPGRAELSMPPRGVTSQTIGLVIEDKKLRPRILPIIPRGSVLPARTNRRLTFKTPSDVMTLEVVESSGINGGGWHTLGHYVLELDKSSSSRTRLLSFEVDINGLLNVRAQSSSTTGSLKLPHLPSTMLSEQAMSEWREELNRLG